MKLRDARRRSAWLFFKGFSEVDYYEYLIRNRFRIVRTRKYYSCRFYLDGAFYFRRHNCALRLAQIVYGMAAERHASFQYTQVNECAQGESSLVETIKLTLAEGFEYRSAPNYGRVSSLKPARINSELQDLVDNVYRSHLTDEFVDGIRDNWQHSSHVEEPERQAPAFNKLATRPLKQMDRSVVKTILLQCLINKKKIEGPGLARVECEFSALHLANCRKNQGSASGILPVKVIPGCMTKTKGTKSDMHSSAVAVNLGVRCFPGIPKSIPFKPFLKGEVIKTTKAVRGIQNESLANYQILTIDSDKTFHDQLDFGNAIGLGGFGKAFTTLFVLWYKIYFTHTKGTWSQFLDYLEDRGAHESDKVGWEATTSINDGLPVAIMTLATKTFKQEGDRRLFVRAVADEFNPFVYIDKGGFFCPFRVPSGTAKTSTDNTDRHDKMVRYVVHWVRMHGGSLGTPDCGCSICVQFDTHAAFGANISLLDLNLRENAMKLGDDYLAVSWGAEQDDFFDRVMDSVFGTETKSEWKRFFGEGEFLRKRFKRNSDNSITWYRDPERILAKLYHGDMLANEQRLAEALTAYKFEAGDSPELIAIFDEIHDMLDADVLDMSAYQRRNPELEDVKNYNQFDYADIVNQQKQLMATAEHVARLENMRF